MLHNLLLAITLLTSCETRVVSEAGGTRAYGGTCPPPTAIAEKVRERQVLLAEEAPVVRPFPKPLREKSVSVPIKKKITKKRIKTQCGLQRAVWYTNKFGRRKYRCR